MRIMVVLLMKFVACLIAFTVGLNLFFTATVTEIVSFSLLVTIVSYFIGDRIVLRLFSNATATIFDFFLTYGVVWIFGSVVLHNYLQIAWGSILSAIIITIGEVFLHYYLISRTEPEAIDRNNPRQNRMAYMTEFAEENENNNPYNED